MADIRELVQQTAPQVDDLDLDAVRTRAQAVRARDQRRQRLAFGAVAGALVLIVGLVASPLLRGGSRWGAEIAVGGKSPLAGVSGPSVLGEGDLSLGDFAGQPLLIHIWAPWCGPCIDGLADLRTVADEVGDGGEHRVQVVTIAVRTDLEQVVRAIEEAGVDLPTMLLAEPDVLASVLLPSDSTFRPITGTTSPVASPCPAPTASEDPVGAPSLQVPTTIAVNADHEVVGTWLGAAQVDELRHMAELATTVTEPNPHVTDQAAPPPAPSELDSPLPLTFPPTSPSDEGLAEPLPTPTPPPADPRHIDRTPSPYPDEGIRTYEVQPGDTLSTIAEAVYGDPLAFGLIASANGLDGYDPLFVCQILTIPPNPGPDGIPTPEPQPALQ